MLVEMVRVSDSVVVAEVTTTGGSEISSSELDNLVAEYCPDISTSYRSAWSPDGTIQLATPGGELRYVVRPQ